MFAHLRQWITDSGHAAAHALYRRLLVATRPSATPLVAGTLTDLARSKPTLIAENALLRQQLVVLQRSVKRPRCTPADRTLLVLLASRCRSWRHALLIVQPDTVLRWHRGGTPEAGHPRGQVDYPEIHARCAAHGHFGPNLGHLPTQPCHGHLGLRLLAGHRPPLPAALRLLRDRARLATGGPCGRNASSDRCLDRPASA